MSPRKTNRDLFNGEIVIAGRAVEPLPGPGGGPLDGGLRLMRALTFDIDDPELEYHLVITLSAIAQRLACSAVTLSTKDGGPPVTGTALRDLPLQSYADLIRRQLLAAMAQGHPALMKEVQRTPEGAHYDMPTPDSVRRLQESQRKRVPPAERLPAVAAVYQEALRSDDGDVSRSPTRAVADEFFISRGHASRLVSEARKAGLIGKAKVKRGVAGIRDEEREDPS